MTINPQSLQILGMVLDRQTRQQEGEANRGHEINMANLSIAQRNLENQISMNFQRQQNAEGMVNNLQNHLMERGVSVDSSKFGDDSQLGEMVKKVGGSLIDQKESLEALTNMQLNELSQLREMGASFSRGANVASAFQATFDADFNIDPESDFGAFNLAVGNEDRMAELFAERNIDIGTNARERHAFLQGASRIFADTSGLLEQERMRMDALASRSQADFNRLQSANLEASQFQSRHEFAQMIAPDLAQYLTGDLLTLASEETSKSDKKALQANIQERIHAGSRSFADTIAQQSGINLDDLYAMEGAGTLSGEDKATIKYFRDLQESYQENAMRHINNLTANPEAFIGGLQNSVKELERALDEYGTVENAIANKAIAPTDLGNIMGFVGNPYINPTLGAGFQALNDIMRRTKAQEELRQNKNFSTALQKATDSFGSSSGIDVGDRLRTVISGNLFPDDTPAEPQESEPSFWQRITGRASRQPSPQESIETMNAVKSKVEAGESISETEAESLMNDREFMVEFHNELRKGGNINRAVNDQIMSFLYGYDAEGNRTTPHNISELFQSPFIVAGKGLEAFKNAVERRNRRLRTEVINRMVQERE